MPKTNTMFRISSVGGLIGMLTTNPHALQALITEQNALGHNVVQISAHQATNLFVWVLQVLVLSCTLGLFTWGGGWLVVFEKEESQ